MSDKDSVRSVGIKFVDDEHDMLLAMLDELRSQRCATGKPDEVAAVLGRLERITRAHFQLEESVLAQDGADALILRRHRAAHEALLRRMDKLIADMAAGDPQVPVKLADMLENWLKDHVVNFDMKMR